MDCFCPLRYLLGEEGTNEMRTREYASRIQNLRVMMGCMAVLDSWLGVPEESRGIGQRVPAGKGVLDLTGCEYSHVAIPSRGFVLETRQS